MNLIFISTIKNIERKNKKKKRERDIYEGGKNTNNQ